MAALLGELGVADRRQAHLGQLRALSWDGLEVPEALARVAAARLAEVSAAAARR